MKSRIENIYCEISGKIFHILKNSVHESLIPTPMIILIILCCSLKILLLYEEFPQKIIP